ncbi:MAG TPA: protein-L-isoaspartate(D-aspartate) O-methyltransferase [Candidatus Xenobia bacterium]
MKRVLLLLFLAVASPLVFAQAPPSVTIAAVGDVLPSLDLPHPCDAILPLLSGADITFANLETPLVAGGQPVSGRLIHHREDPAAAVGLPFSLLCLANNHMMDYGTAGVASTVRAVERAGIRPVGVEGCREQTLEVHGLTLSILGYSASYEAARPDFPVCRLAPDVMEARVRALAGAGHIVLVSLHWGQEDDDRPLPDQRKLADRLVDAGASLVLGSHPHVWQGVERHGRGIVLYSMGNFVWPRALGYRTETAVARVILTQAGATDCTLAPVTIDGGRPRPAEGLQAQDILQRLCILCRELGGTADTLGDRLVVEPPALAATHIPLARGEAVLSGGRLVVVKDGEPVWQSPADRYIVQAIPATVFDGQTDLVLLLRTVTGEKFWAGDHWDVPEGVRPLTQHIGVVGPGREGSEWRMHWLSSALPQRVQRIEMEGRILHSTELRAGNVERHDYHWTGWAFTEAEDAAFVARRHQMVRDLLPAMGVRNADVLSAARRIPRQDFVPAEQQEHAYENRTLPVGWGQTIPTPVFMALQAQYLTLHRADRVLEVGTGSGYQAALMACLARDVYSIEILPELGRRAASTWRRLGIDTIHLRIGDGSQGWAEHAPYDAILVTAAPPRVPKALLDQLADGGRMLIPLGPPQSDKTLWLIRKVHDRLSFARMGQVMVVPMDLPDPNEPAIDPPSGGG